MKSQGLVIFNGKEEPIRVVTRFGAVWSITALRDDLPYPALQASFAFGRCCEISLPRNTISIPYEKSCSYWNAHTKSRKAGFNADRLYLTNLHHHRAHVRFSLLHGTFADLRHQQP